ncbi:hypothetical protein [Nitratidesulfovibrio vulgaris]|uniref:hypothetical protein n=1 Tax=Nitratidesulfovibrio vulgaris TaxID=881 RepID=UPI0013DEC244|nr:hypothetical protein [Nitratidesulfovibrio vulgaris]
MSSRTARAMTACPYQAGYLVMAGLHLVHRIGRHASSPRLVITWGHPAGCALSSE